MKLTLFFFIPYVGYEQVLYYECKKGEVHIHYKKKGYYMRNKEEKDIKVKVVYGNKTLLECMKNIIKNSRK